MQPREKYLLIGLLTAVVLWQGVPIVTSIVMDPINMRNTRIQSLGKSVEEKEIRELDLMRALALRGKLKTRSLPPDPNRAQTLYQQWLTDLANMAGFVEPEVIPRGRNDSRDVFQQISVSINTQARMDQVCQFMYWFYRADLAQHLTIIDMTCAEVEGDPLIEISMTAEGLSLVNAPPRSTLFPQAFLASDIPAGATSFEVVDPYNFPKEAPFRVRIDSEYFTVTAMDENKWTVEPASDMTVASAHQQSDFVELSPINEDYADITPENYRDFLPFNPFVKPPPPYEPEFAPIGLVDYVRGDPLKQKIAVVGFNPAEGTYRLSGDIQTGMSIDPTTGELTWDAPDEQAVGEYPVTVELAKGNEESHLSQVVKIELREPNVPPEFEAIDEQVAVLGREYKLKLSAEDKGPNATEITYKLGEGAPEGAAIDEKSGELTWTPPVTLTPGQINLVVEATDIGRPPATTPLSIPLQVIDDKAQFTFYTGYVTQDDVPMAMFYNRLDNTTFYLSNGQSMNYGGIKGVVRKIERKYILFEINGKLWRVPHGENLRSMRESVETAATS